MPQSQCQQWCCKNAIMQYLAGGRHLVSTKKLPLDRTGPQYWKDVKVEHQAVRWWGELSREGEEGRRRARGVELEKGRTSRWIRPGREWVQYRGFHQILYTLQSCRSLHGFPWFCANSRPGTGLSKHTGASHVQHWVRELIILESGNGIELQIK